MTNRSCTSCQTDLSDASYLFTLGLKLSGGMQFIIGKPKGSILDGGYNFCSSDCLIKFVKQFDIKHLKQKIIKEKLD